MKYSKREKQKRCD